MGVTIGRKKLKKGRVSLFLDISLFGQRWKEYLRIYLEETSTKTSHNEYAMKLANLCRQRREEQLAELRLQWKEDAKKTFMVDFFEIYNSFLMTYYRKDVKVVQATLNYLKRFESNPTLPITKINKEYCERFMAFLAEHLHGNTPMGYFKKFKMCLEKCVDMGLYTVNPAKKIRLNTSDELQKDILNAEEIQKLADTSSLHAEVSRAFLLACQTGLRWCDVVTLKYKQIDYRRNVIVVCQHKVIGHSSKALLYLNMNETVHRLLSLHTGNPDDLVFRLPSYSYANRVLAKWVIAAGIQKHITFHCARHSFVTNILLAGANIKTASVLAGHSSVRHTERYIHVIDDLKQKAVNSLTPIKLNF